MYYEYYGLNRPPFQLTLDRLCVYFGAGQRDAMAQLLYGIREGKGLLVLEGEPGTGKTTLLDALTAMLPAHMNMPVCWLRNAMLRAPIDLLEAILLGYRRGCARGARIGEVSERLFQFLAECAGGGLAPLLIVDEAQELRPRAMKQLRLLTNWERDGQAMIRIILAGQTELGRRYLDAPAHAALRQRVTLRCRLRALPENETADYVRLRLREAGGSCREIFSPEALAELHFHAGGVPRRINVLADHSLVAGYAAGQRPVAGMTVAMAAAELGYSPAGDGAAPAPPPPDPVDVELKDLFRAFLCEDARSLPGTLTGAPQ